MAKILELKNPEEHEDEIVPVDQWNGECWKTFFDQFCVPAGEQHGVSPWEYLANFIKTVYSSGGEVNR